MPGYTKQHVESLNKEFQLEKSKRSWWDQQYQEVKDLIRPNTSDFNHTSAKGERKFDQIYDATAIDACEEFAGGLSSYMTNPSDRWFSLTIDGIEDPRSSIGLDVFQWLEDVSDIIYDEYANSNSNFNGAIHECYQDLGAFGVQVLHQFWDAELKSLSFKCIPLADCWFRENHRNMVDTIWRKVMMTPRQIEKKWGMLPPDLARMDRVDDEVEVIHHVRPREDYTPSKRDAVNKKFASIWWCTKTKELLHESGFDEFPFHISRWSKISGETYGRGPGLKVLPDIKVLNRLERIMLRAGSKMIDPPLQVPNDGFLLPLKTSPGALLFKEPSTEDIKPLDINANLPFGMELMDQKREAVRKGFHNDLLRQDKNNVEMTAFETQDRREEKLRLLSPMLGRQESELLGPMIGLSFFFLNKAGRIPPPPGAAQGLEMSVDYTSPASKAQTGVRALAMDRYIQRILPMAQINPNVMDRIDLDVWSSELAKAMGTPVTIIRTDKQVQEIRAQRQKQEQQEQLVAAAEPASKALKNITEAQQIGQGG